MGREQGRRLTELRRSGAAGFHVKSGTRSQANREAIDEQLGGTMASEVTYLPTSLDMLDGPSEADLAEIEAEGNPFGDDEDYAYSVEDGEDDYPQDDE